MTVNVGFQPSFVIISRQGEATDPGMNFGYVALAGETVLLGYVNFTSTGFAVHYYGTSNTYPQLSQKNRQYASIAFR